MQKISLAIFTGLVFAGCQTAEKKTLYNDLGTENLKGKVTSYESAPYTADSTGKIGEMDSCCVFKMEFDQDGYLVNTSTKTKAGAESSGEKYSRHENKKMKEVVNTTNGKPSGRLAISLDSAGNYAKAEHFDSSGKMDVYYDGITVDEYDNIVSGKQYNADGSLKSTWINKFTKQAYVGGESTDSTGKKTWTSTQELDDKQNPIKFSSTEIKKDTTINKTITYKYTAYDTEGNWTERTEMEPGKPNKVIKRTFTYAKKE